MGRSALLILSVVLFSLSAPKDVSAQGDGARAWQLVPDGTRSLTAFGIYAQGNQSADPSTVVQGAKVDIDLGQLQYTQTFALAGEQVQAFGILPFGRVKGSVNRASGTESASVSGLGDATVGAMLGLVGAPALAAKEYDQHQPGFTLGALGKITIPTGEYDSSRPISLGANRWALQLGAPIVQYFGKSLLDPSLASLELTPSVTFFTSNNDPHNANTRTQDPLAKLEGHITRNVGPAFWVSLDALYSRGGETTTDGTRDGNSQRWLGLGTTGGIAFSDKVSGAVTYGKIVRHNAGGADARGLRADAVFAF
ncbi:MAG TPA: transporter [Burkholderiales bacterium]|nr:transporter [Burkholderiales bacterium]